MPNDYYLRNKEKIISASRKFYRAKRGSMTLEQLEDQRRKVREQVKRWRLNHSERQNEYRKQYRSFPQAKLSTAITTKISELRKTKGIDKKSYFWDCVIGLTRAEILNRFPNTK